MPSARSPLNASRRQFRRILINEWPAGDMPWYARGRLLQHYTPGLFTIGAFCGARVTGNSSAPIRTPIGIHCPACTSILKSIARRIAADTENQEKNR
jgi:hypothetical protein